MAQLTVGSLFSGIGGLDLGLERAGMKVVWQSEIDPYACQVLKKHWPEVPNHGDIKQIDWSMVERPAVVCGGYPCQPFSQAGHRKGEEDPRHLWPWVRQAISELRPDYAILENVRGHLSLGGTTVIADLAAIGYDAEWRIVSAASVGANHRRDRIIIVAYPNSERTQVPVAGGQPAITLPRGHGSKGGTNDVADTDCGDTADGRQCALVPGESRSEGNDGSRSGGDTGEISVEGAGQTASNVAYPEVFRSQSSRDLAYRKDTFTGHGTTGNDCRAGTISDWWETEPDVGRVADGVPNRVDRLRGLGNAVVPQVAEVIGRLVVEHATHN